MHKAKIKLPPKLRENLDKEDKVAEIALQYRDKLRGIPSQPQPQSQEKIEAPKPEPKVLPKVEATNESAGFGDEVKQEAGKLIDIRLAVASAVIGSVVGLLFLYNLSENE